MKEESRGLPIELQIFNIFMSYHLLTSTIIQIDIKWKESNKIWLDEKMSKLVKFRFISRNVTIGSEFDEPNHKYQSVTQTN